MASNSILLRLTVAGTRRKPISHLSRRKNCSEPSFAALLQRRKNRDLFDLHEGLRQLSMDPDKLIACFEHYLALEGMSIMRANAEQRMLEKLRRSLTDDIAPLLPAGIRFDDDAAMDAFNHVWRELIVRIKGEPWKLSEQVIDELRNGEMPNLLR